MTRYAHIVRLALFGGWLLMCPPPVAKPGNPDAPIAEWKQLSAHDTATGCQNTLSELLHDAAAILANGISASKAERDRADCWIDAKCVPSEAVYPAVKRP